MFSEYEYIIHAPPTVLNLHIAWTIFKEMWITNLTIISKGTYPAWSSKLIWKRVSDKIEPWRISASMEYSSDVKFPITTRIVRPLQKIVLQWCQQRNRKVNTLIPLLGEERRQIWLKMAIGPCWTLAIFQHYGKISLVYGIWKILLTGRGSIKIQRPRGGSD